jgi:hypothetical protein
MQGDDEERRARAAHPIRQGVIAWLLGHAFLSAMLLGAIYKPDPAAVKMLAYVMIALTPIAVAWLYLEARATWLGKDDPEMAPAIATLSIAAAVAALAWYLG